MDDPDKTKKGIRTEHDTVVDIPIRQGEDAATDTVIDQDAASSTIVVPDDPSPPRKRAAERTVVVPDEDEPAKASVAGSTVFVSDDEDEPALPPRLERKRKSIVGPLVLLIAMLLVVVAAVVIVPTLLEDDPVPTPTDPLPSISRCEGDAPSAVVLLRLASGEDVPSIDEIRSSLAGLPEDSVLVHRLSTENDTVAARFVTFELTSSSWPEWNGIAGDARGEEVCRRVGAALAARMGNRADGVELYSARDANVRDETIGALSSFATGNGYSHVLDWLEPIEARAQCSFEPDYWGGGTLVITCDLTSPRNGRARVRVTPTLYRNEAVERGRHEELILEARAHVSRRYELRDRPQDDIGSSCGCEVETQRADR